MKSRFFIVNSLCVLCVLCGLAHALDRNAFTFTKYQLTASIDPDQQRLGVRGIVTLRNDSSAPQKDIALQISSTLSWKSIQFEGKSVEFLTHIYTSDIDHTGELSEAIVTLPNDVAPKQAIELSIGYEGTIPRDATRLTRIGIPAETTRHTDWDQISPSFTAVRGIGYVVWYPVSTEAASLSDGNSVEKTVGRWKQRHSESSMDILFESSVDKTILFSGVANLAEVNVPADIVKIADFGMRRFGTDVPTFIIADYHKAAGDAISNVYWLKGHEQAAASLNKQVMDLQPTVRLYGFGGGIEILDTPESGAAPFLSAHLLLMSFDSLLRDETKLTLVYALARAQIHSRRAWMQEGLAHYAQAAYLEQERGRQAALDYLNDHNAELVESEKANSKSPQADNGSLLNGVDNIQFQSKALRVWWMLHDMLGSAGNPALLLWHNYQFSEDQSPNYIQKLIESKTHRDLQWFFDDWVYHDRGLPDFRITSVFSSPMASGGYLVTVTVQNLGNAGAEVPVVLQIAGGDTTHRLKVLANAKASIRFEVPAAPQRATVNDGSVPESDVSNNSYVLKK
jgi:hypothetical protein